MNDVGASPPLGTGDTTALRDALVEQLKDDGYVTMPRVEVALRAVPRHLFLPGVELERVYRDEAVPTKLQDGVAISSSSQPAIMAVMLEQLDLQPGHRVLEIGAGTGYNAALMAHIVGHSGHVVTVDIDDDIVQDARAHLAAAGFERVEVVCGDGGLGFPEGAPYDRIILTVGASDIAPAWRQQLKPGGRLVLPLGLRGPQVSVAFEPARGYLASVSVRPCGFMRLRGAFAGSEQVVPLGPDPDLCITAQGVEPLDPDELYASLSGRSRERVVAVPMTMRDVFGGFSLWLALHEPGVCAVEGRGAPIERGIVPGLFRWSDTSGATIGLVDGPALAVLVGPSEGWCSTEDEGGPPFNARVRSFGSGETTAERLVDQIEAWDRAGRPSAESLRIRAYPRTARISASPDQVVLRNRWSRLVIERA
jgi:protein-L-isoaspartate(D-aspartate) O-methyltransferase